MSLSKRFHSKLSRMWLVGTLFWIIGWTVFANFTFDTVCSIPISDAANPLQAVVSCRDAEAEYVWGDKQWNSYWVGLFALPVSTVIIHDLIGWIRSGE